MKKSPAPYGVIPKKAAEDFRALPLERRVAALKRIGILDKDGKLAAHYRRATKPKGS